MPHILRNSMLRFGLITVMLAGTASWTSLRAELLDPESLTKYIDPLPIPGPMSSVSPNYYEIGMYQTAQQLHGELPMTVVWGYGPDSAHASYPAATIEAVRGTPIQVKWTNHLPYEHLLAYAIDTTLHMAHAIDGVPVVAHLHGGESEAPSDGNPEAWFTQGFAEKGSAWVHETYTYYNNQLPTTLWYHDHALGLTRLNVYAGLAGFYLLRDPAIEGPMNLPSGAYEIPLVIQDRQFTEDGQLSYPHDGDNPEHPVWTPEFFGDVILVNGKVWPYLEVEQRKYRFRVLNGSNARFYVLRLVDESTTGPGPAFWQIGTDGGYLDSPVMLNDPSNPNAPPLVLAPGERADLIVDFSAVPVGTRFILDNKARSPFPKGDVVDPNTTGQIMEFRVIPTGSPDNSSISGGDALPTLGEPTVIRTLTLIEQEGEEGPLAAFLDGRMWNGTPTELSTNGTTELWEVINLTGDAHPIHLHLVQFQPVERQKVNIHRYNKAWMAANPILPSDDITTIPIDRYLIGRPTPALPNERGWKDTWQMFPGEVSRLLVRFATQEGGPYPFDPTAFPGYVWHCHILEHEDNEMMRPLYVMEAPALAPGRMAPEYASPGYKLEANYPNPFNPATVIGFTLPVQAQVRIEVINMLGQTVATLVDQLLAAGEHRVEWQGRNQRGERVASGVYFYRLVTGDYTVTRAMLMLK